jgi:hypothetical protein
VTGSPQEEAGTGEPSGGNVESPQVAAQTGGWVGHETAGRAPVAGNDHDGAAPGDREAADWERAREWEWEWADSTPDWSDARWRKVNARLGYQVVSGRKAKSRPPKDGGGSGPGRAAGDGG